MSSVYQINKGINKAIEFKGLKAQYIWYCGGGVMLLLILFALMYVAGVHTVICIGFVGIAGSFMIIKIYALSHKYGEFGLMKMMARKMVPKVLKSKSRKVFADLQKIKGQL